MGRFFYVSQEPDKWKCRETGPTVFRPYPRRLKSLTVWKWTLSVGPAAVWTRDLSLSRPVFSQLNYPDVCEVTPLRSSIVLYPASFCAVFLTSNQRRSDPNAKKHLRTWKEKTSKMNKREKNRGKEQRIDLNSHLLYFLCLIIFTLISGRALLYVWALQCALWYNLRRCKENRMLPRNSLRWLPPVQVRIRMQFFGMFML